MLIKGSCVILFIYARFWLCVFACVYLQAAWAVDANPEQLRQLEVRIRALQSRMHDTQTEYGQLQQQLQQSEETIGEIVERIKQINIDLAEQQAHLAELQQQRAQQLQQLAAQRTVLARQIQAAYIIGRQDYLKLWLNQESPDHIGRLLTYYDYFNRARANQIEIINDTLAQIDTLEKAIARENTRLNELINTLNSRKTALEASQTERQGILSELATTLASQESELKRLQEDKQQLGVLIGSLDDALKDLPQPKTEPFAKLRGQLPLPVQGKISRQFGSQRAGRLKWQGVLITANLGDKVTAVADGRVVFAEWFRNLGLLVILDHNQGYMTLYGYNQSLAVKVGDWVRAGTELGSVGESGGQAQPALYFEIRRRGEPIDPKQWLQKN